MLIARKIEKLFGARTPDPSLLKLYHNYNGDSLNEFMDDCDKMFELRKLLRKVMNGKSNFNFNAIFNRYTLLKNIFDLPGIVYIAANYFSEDETLFEYFCSLVYYEESVQISNRMNTEFLKLLEEKDTRM